MSYLLEQESVCPNCQFPNPVETWSVINVKTDPELKDLLLGGEINMAECQSCHELFYAEHFLLYHDPDMELMAFVYPHDFSEEKEKWEQKTKGDFAKTQEAADEEKKLNYEPVTLFGLDQLVFLVEDEEEMTIQGEIVSIYSADHHFKIKVLRPSDARAKKLPMILPYTESENGPTRNGVIAAIGKVLEVNERLFVYGKLKASLMENPGWSLTN